MITPPVELTVYVMSSAFSSKLALTDVIFRGVLWFFVAYLFHVALLAWVPDIIMFIPRTFS